MHVQRRSNGFLLSKHQYMLDILACASMYACKHCSTPVDTNPNLSALVGTPLQDSEALDFRSLAGALQYLTFTRPDIAYASMLLGTFT
jgi:hypothetical protein